MCAIVTPPSTIVYVLPTNCFAVPAYMYGQTPMPSLCCCTIMMA
jgi:hypothetical protein